jgi:hypothetical protein
LGGAGADTVGRICKDRASGRVGEDRSFRVLDYWRSHWDFEAFREEYQHDLEQFRRWLANKDLVEHEKLVASFYTDESDEADDAGLVLR